MSLYDKLAGFLFDVEPIVRARIERRGADLEMHFALLIMEHENDDGPHLFEARMLSGTSTIGVEDAKCTKLAILIKDEDEHTRSSFERWTSQLTNHFAQPKGRVILLQTFVYGKADPVSTEGISVGNLSLAAMMNTIWQEAQHIAMPPFVQASLRDFVFACRNEARKAHPTLC